jgi:acetylornithine deacetylase
MIGMSDVAELVGQLVAIDSVNPDLVPGGRGEHAIATLVAGWLDRAGLDVTLDEVVLGRPNVIAIARGTGGGRSLMLNGHLDTVGTLGMHDPHAPRIVDDRLYGRGAYDMKGGLAAIMLAGAAAARQRLRGDVIVTAVIDEEHASLGTQRVLERWHADAAVVAEATGLDLCIAHKGFVWLDVDVTGEAAHGSRPDLGIDAIAQMGKVLVQLDRLHRRLQSRAGHPLVGSGSVHASLIAGGQELSSYPAHCTLSIERRTVPGETPEVVEAEIRSIIARLAADDPQFRASVARRLARSSFSISEDAPIVKVLRQEAATVRGRAPALVGVPWWMDSALLSDAGIPTVIFGPGGEGAHATVEWVSLDEVERCAAALIATARAFCA